MRYHMTECDLYDSFSPAGGEGGRRPDEGEFCNSRSTTNPTTFALTPPLSLKGEEIFDSFDNHG